MYTNCCGPAGCSSFRCKAALRPGAHREIPGWEHPSRNKTRAAWPRGAVSRCAIRAAPENNTTGFGSSGTRTRGVRSSRGESSITLGSIRVRLAFAPSRPVALHALGDFLALAGIHGFPAAALHALGQNGDVSGTSLEFLQRSDDAL